MWPFHTHDWRVVGIDHVKLIHTSSGQRLVGGDATLVKYRCASCARVRAEQLDGTWSRAELTGEAAVSGSCFPLPSPKRTGEG